jgi:hypothetical protein
MSPDGLPSDPYDLAKVAASAILERFEITQLKIAFVLGSGWSAAADDLGQPIGSCELAELPGFAPPTVIGHGGTLRIVSTSRARSRRSSPGVLTSTKDMGWTRWYTGCDRQSLPAPQSSC